MIVENAQRWWAASRLSLVPRPGSRDAANAARLAAWLMVAIALVVRIHPFVDDVFKKEGVRPWRCPDVHYHLHRIEIGARHWPWLPELDRWRNYPEGAYSLWGPLYDWIPATAARWTGFSPLHVGVVWPALLGALALLPLYSVSKRLHGNLAWLGVATFAVLPGAVSFSLLGRTDHHVGEVLMQLVTYALALRDLQSFEAGRTPRAGSAIALGVTMGLSLWVSRGTLVFLAVPALVALVSILRSNEPIWRVAAVRHFSVAFAAAAATAAPYGLWNVVRGRDLVSAYFLSLFQPAVLLVVALLVPLAARVTLRGPRRFERVGSRAAWLVTAIAALTAFTLAGVKSGAAFLTRHGDAWAATIEESQPLWAGGRATLFVIEQLGFVPVALPLVALAQLAWAVRCKERFATAFFSFAATACATALLFLQVRFVYYAAPVVAAVPGGVVWALQHRSRGLRAGALAIAFALLWPTYHFWRNAIDGDPRTQMSIPHLEPQLSGLLSRLVSSTPSAGDVRRPDVQPAYCVLAPWSLGNFIQTLAERPVLASSGGPHETPAYWDTVAFQQRVREEHEAAALMEARGCRYAITEHVPPEVEPEQATRLFARRLHDHSGSDHDDQEGSGRFRWRFESDHGVHEPARYKVFELVRGAVLNLPAGAATRVVVRVEGASAPSVYLRRLRAAGAGRLATRVSQPGTYRILGEDDQPLGQVRVSEQAVLEGRTLELARAAEPASTPP